MKYKVYTLLFKIVYIPHNYLLKSLTQMEHKSYQIVDLETIVRFKLGDRRD